MAPVLTAAVLLATACVGGDDAEQGRTPVERSTPSTPGTTSAALDGPAEEGRVRRTVDCVETTVLPCLRQSVELSIPVPGTLATLSYSSDRQRVVAHNSELRDWVGEVGLGGWTLDLVHHLDVEAKLIHYGDGTSETIEPVTLSGDARGHLAVASPADDVYLFSAEGRHVATVDALEGLELLTVAYGDDGSLSEIRHASGRTLRIVRRDDDTVTIEGGGGDTHLAMDGDGHLARVADIVGAESVMVPDQRGLLTSFTDADGGSSLYSYDSAGRLTAERDPLGVTTRWTRRDTDSGYSVVRTESSGATTSWTVAEDEDSRTVTLSPADRLEITERATRDRHQVAWPDGTTVDLRLAPDPRWGWQLPLVAEAVLTIDDRDPLTIRTSVEAAGADDDPFEATAIRELSEIGGAAYESVWDGSERRITSTTPGGRTASVDYDADGRVIAQRVGSNHHSISYGTGDLLSSVQWGDDGPRLRFEYDTDGIVMNGPEGLSHRSEFDAAGRQIGTQVSTSGHASAERLPSGVLSSTVPDGGGEGELSYTGDGRIAQFELGGDVIRTWKYDAHGRAVGYEDGDGRTVALTYDAQSRPDGIATDGDVVEYRWDESTGRLAAIDGETVQVARRYAGPLLVAETWSGAIAGSVERTLDDRLRVSEVTVEGASIPISYDADDLVVGIGSAVIERDGELGAIRRISLGELVEERRYDSLGQLDSSRVSAGDQDIYRINVTRDELGRVVERHERTGTGPTRVTSLTYDEAGQLIEVTVDGTVTERYLYDQLGNRIPASSRDDPPKVSYDHAGRIIADGETTYDYDDAGRLEARSGPDGTVRFDYDPQGRLRGVSRDDGRTVRYDHDGVGRRVASTIDGVAGTALLYLDEQRPVAAVGAAGVDRVFGYADDELTPLTMVKDGRQYLIVSDETGSPRLVVDAETGDIAQRIDYGAFGRVLADSAPGFQPFAFGGGINDPVSGLVRFGHRDYDPNSGRWTAVDPILYGGGDVNLYRYVGNDPVNRSDPSGLDPPSGPRWKRRAHVAWIVVDCLIGLPQYYENCIDIDMEDIEPGPESHFDDEIDQRLNPDRMNPKPGPRDHPYDERRPPRRIERPPPARTRPAQPPWRGPWRGKRHYGFFGGPWGLALEVNSWASDTAAALGEWFRSFDLDLPRPDGDTGAGGRPREPHLSCGTTDECLNSPNRRSQVKGEPHITTFDGLRLSFQATGEFVYVEEGDITIQTRFEGSVGAATSTSATAIGSDGHVLEVIYEDAKSESIGDAISVRIDGERRTVNSEVTDVGDMSIVATRRGDAVNVYAETESGWFIAVENLNVSQNIILLAPTHVAQASGLTGSPNADHTDDLRLRDGTSLPLDALDTVQGLYGTYAAEWRVRPDERLFTDTPAEMWTTEQMTALPDVVLSLGDLPAEDVRAARVACVDAGVPAGPELEDCTFDVAVTGDTSWADQQAESDTSQRIDVSGGEERQADDPLFVAAHKCRIDDLTALLAGGADVTISRADDGWTALMFAAQHDCPEVVTALLDAGADPAASNDDGFFPLYLAAQNGRTAVVQALLDAGAPTQQALPSGDTPLLIATFNGHPEVVDLLIRRGTDPDIAREDGVTPVIAATQGSDLTILRSLLAAGADVNRATFDGLSTPLHFATDGDLDVVSALLDAGADVARRDDRGNTALHYAASDGTADVVRVLLAAGANPDITNSRDLSPRDVADESVAQLFEP